MESLETLKEFENIITASIVNGDLATIECNIDSVTLSNDAEKLSCYKLLCVAIDCQNRYPHNASPAQKNKIIKLMLDKNFPVNSTEENYRDTPLYSAIENNDEQLVGMLLDKGAEIDKVCFYGRNSFDVALINGNKRILKMLVNRVSDDNISDRSYFRLLANLFQEKCGDLIEQLLLKCRHINLKEAMSGYNYLNKAVENKYYKVIDILLERGIDINYIDYTCYNCLTPLCRACENGDLNMVKFLLQRGANPNMKVGFYTEKALIDADSLYPIHKAVGHSDRSILEELVKYGANVNQLSGYPGSVGRSALYEACYYGSEDQAQFLVDKGADFNWKDSDGTLLITTAVANDDESVFKYLLSIMNVELLDLENAEEILREGAQWCDRDYLTSIITYIQKFKSQSSLRYQLDCVMFKNRVRRPLLHIAVKSSSITYFKPLIEYGADINFVNSRGRTPLHTAFQCRLQRSIEGLLEYGADINLICDDGYTPLDYAIEDHLYDQRVVDDEDCEDKPRAGDNLNDIVDYFTQHILKLRILNLRVSQSNYDDLISRSDDPFRHQKNYKKEVEKMKEEFITKEVNYYDIVTADLYKMVAYLKNDVIFNTLKSGSFEKMFPHFETIIKGCFWRGFQRKRLLEEVSEFPDFDLIFNLPYPCMRNIMKYFNNSDLKGFLIKAHCPGEI